MTFTLDQFVADTRNAVARPDALSVACALLARSLDAAAAIEPIYTKADETLLHKDASVSVRHERF